jgi:hypothetical protein
MAKVEPGIIKDEKMDELNLKTRQKSISNQDSNEDRGSRTIWLLTMACFRTSLRNLLLVLHHWWMSPLHWAQHGTNLFFITASSFRLIAFPLWGPTILLSYNRPSLLFSASLLLPSLILVYPLHLQNLDTRLLSVQLLPVFWLACLHCRGKVAWPPSYLSLYIETFNNQIVCSRCSGCTLPSVSGPYFLLLYNAIDPLANTWWWACWDPPNGPCHVNSAVPL